MPEREYTQPERFYLCYLASTGIHAMFFTERAPADVAPHGRMTMTVQREMAKTMRQQGILMPKPGKVYYGEMKEMLRPERTVAVLRDMVRNHPEWEKVLAPHSAYASQRYLMEIARMLEEKSEDIEHAYSFPAYAEKGENEYVWAALLPVVAGEKAEAVCRILNDRALYPVLETLLDRAEKTGDRAQMERVGEILGNRARQTEEWHRIYGRYRMVYLYRTGELLPLPHAENYCPEVHYTSAVGLACAGRIDEAIEAFGKGLKQISGSRKWKVIPRDGISFLVYVTALGIRRQEKDLAALRAILKFREDTDMAPMRPVMELADYLQDNSRPKDRESLAALLPAESEYAIIQRERAAFCNGEPGPWPYEPLLTRVKTRERWELQLEELLHLTERIADEDAPEAEKKNAEARLAYVDVGWDNELEVREQNRLRNGTWGKGRKVSYSRYEVADCAMDETDRRIYEAWKQKERSKSRYRQFFPSFCLALPLLKGTDKLMMDKFRCIGPVRLVEEQAFVKTEQKEGIIRFSSNIPAAAELLPSMYLDRTDREQWTYYPLSVETRQVIERLMAIGEVPAEAEPMVKTLLKSLGRQVEIHSPLAEGCEQMPEKIEGTTLLTLRLTPAGEGFTAELCIRAAEGSEKTLFPGAGDETVYDIVAGRRVEIRRDLRAEYQRMEEMNRIWTGRVGDEPFSRRRSRQPITAEALLALLEIAPEHEDLFGTEWPEGERIRLRKAEPQAFEIASHTGNGWLELEGKLRIDENRVMSVGKLLAMMRESEGKYIRLGENEYLAMSESLKRQLARLDAMAETKGDTVRVPSLAMAVAGDSLAGELPIEEPEPMVELRRRIRESENIHIAVPDTLNVTLRDYQEDGYRWMMRLAHWGAGACLADDMGLGKTVQSIAFLLAHAQEGPQMVVAPASVVSNWQRELARFAPTMNVCMLHETAVEDRRKMLRQMGEWGVLVSTYGLLITEGEALADKEWQTVCLDEAHTIKNRDTRSSAAAMALRARCRLILTGTPIQNHLGELWNLMQFINPGLLGSYAHFAERYIAPIAAGNEDTKQQLRRVIAPFMLRRTKTEVARELPDKMEIRVPVRLSEEEMAVYELIRREAKAELESVGAGSGQVSMKVLSMITRLREAACAASLAEKGWTGTSSKLEAMVDKLIPMVEEGNRVLVFSQFTSFLEMACEAMEAAGIREYFYLDGSTPIRERQKMVEAFQRGEKQVFVISLKAGGLGLNLTGANYVIHLDPWWNPAIEQQATDRAYRIGQRQRVTVYHLIAEHTIEEKILRLHETKRSLADSLLEGTDRSHRLTARELMELITDNR